MSIVQIVVVIVLSAFAGSGAGSVQAGNSGSIADEKNDILGLREGRNRANCSRDQKQNDFVAHIGSR